MTFFIICCSEIAIHDAALSWLADISDGDARIALSNLQIILQSNDSPKTVITIKDIEEKIKVYDLCPW